MAPANLRPLRAHPTDLLGCSLQHQLVPQPAAGIPERYDKSSPDSPHTICKQGQPLGGTDSHMSGGPDDAHIAGEQDALAPVDAGLLHLDSQVGNGEERTRIKANRVIEGVDWSPTNE